MAGERVRETVRTYDSKQARGDVLAGLTVAVVAVPQSMAYAIIAGVPPEYGLYSVIFQSLVAAIFNSQPLLSVGPMITQSLLVASTVTRLADPGDTGLYVQLVLTLTLAKGLMQVAMSGVRLGHLVRYVSGSVVIGFTAGAGVLIATGQVAAFLGVSTQRSMHDWPGVIGDIQRLLPHLADASGASVALGLLAVGIVIGGRYLSRLAPGPLVAVAVTGGIVYGVGWTMADFGLIGEIVRPRSLGELFWWPSLKLDAGLWERLLIGAVALSVMGLLEAYSIGKTLAVRGGGRVSANQELFSQGLMNATTAFLHCIPGSGSFSRSALNQFAGAQTWLANIFNALFVTVIFLMLAPAAKYVPMSALAAIMFVIAWGLIDWHHFLRIAATSRGDAAVCLGTFLATLVAPLAYAVFIGIVLNLALYLRKAGRLHMNELIQAPGGRYLERPIGERGDRGGGGGQKVMFLQIEGDLFFALADELDDRLTALARSPVRVVVLRLKRTHSVDSTVLDVLERFIRHMHDRGGHVVLCGLRPQLRERLDAFGISALLGDANLFDTGIGIFTSAKQALQRAHELTRDKP